MVMILLRTNLLLASGLLMAGCALGAQMDGRTAPDPAAVFANPPSEAHPGVYWFWMGSNVTTNGIRADVAWFKRMGITSAAIFALSDVCTPWATDVPNGPTEGLLPYTPRWWAFVRFAAEEGKRNGVEVGISNCPGYTGAGGPWVKPEDALRELVFRAVDVQSTGAAVTAALPPPKIDLHAHTAFPVMNPVTGRLERPECPARRTDLRDIAVLAFPAGRSCAAKDVRDVTAGFDAKSGVFKGTLPAGKWTLLRVADIPTGSFTQPNPWGTFGLQCDMMSERAVRAHLDHVFGDIRRYVGADPAALGLTFFLVDSYEAGTPSWTPLMREEFTKRRGYDPLPYLPVLAGHAVGDAKKFRADFTRTVADLYRDNFYRLTGEMSRTNGLAFGCEPYTGPFKTAECAPFIDRLMTEFWAERKARYDAPKPLGWEAWPTWNGKPRRIVESEAFTAGPNVSLWDETPAIIKPIGDYQYCRGINRFILHMCALQPWDSSVRPGMAMGRWGTHFGRNQTWAESGRAWFDYLARSQALLQWGTAADAPRFEGLPPNVAWGGVGRADGASRVYYVANLADGAVSARVLCPVKGPAPEWFDPVTGRIAALARFEAQGDVTAVPLTLAAHQSGFLVFRPGIRDLPFGREVQGAAIRDLFAVSGRWSVRFDPSVGGPKEPVAMDALADWTKNADPRVRYYSGTAVYSIDFDAAAPLPAPRLAKAPVTPLRLRLGRINDQIAAVTLNGRDLGTVWCEPNEVEIPLGLLQEKGNRLEIRFTNVWANRLIGDEQEPADCEWRDAPLPIGSYLVKFPDWFRNGQPRPSTNRVCFTTWNYFTAKSPLVPSGLLGPVTVAVVEEK